MPPQSRGGAMKLKPPPTPAGFQSKSTPNLPTLRSLNRLTADDNGTPRAAHPGHIGSPEIVTSPAESIDDFTLDSSLDAAFPYDDEDDSEEEDAEEAGNTSKLPVRPVHHRHSRSHTHLPSTFAPPFYNRPPTPLPPSPSLTSLLRPNFSATSRPTTPDPSSDEGGAPAHTAKDTTGTATGTQTPNSTAAQSTLTSALRSASKPIPRASPKVPTYEYYGFTLYLTSSLAFIVYLLWSFLPSPFLHSMGIYYYPNRWWALAIPAWIVMFIVYIYVALASYNTGYLTLSMNNVECLVDDAANIAVIDAEGRIIRDDRPSWQIASADDKIGTNKKSGRSKQTGLGRAQTQRSELEWRELWKEGTDAVMDIPVGGVCEILYGRGYDDMRDDG